MRRLEDAAEGGVVDAPVRIKVADVSAKGDDVVDCLASLFREARDGFRLDDTFRHGAPPRNAETMGPPFTGSGIPATMSVTATDRAASSWFRKP